MLMLSVYIDIECSEDRREQLEAEVSRLLLLREQEQERHGASVAALQSELAALKKDGANTKAAGAGTAPSTPTEPAAAANPCTDAVQDCAQVRAELSLLRMSTWPSSLSEAHEKQAVARERQASIKAAFESAWTAYETDAFGRDDLKPIGRTGSDWLGMGVAIVDSLDTMLLMGLGQSAAYQRARTWSVFCSIV